jgi:uncharacterized protein (DUF1800 family)
MSVSFQTMAAIRFGYGFRPGESGPQDIQALLGQLKTGAQNPPSFPAGGTDACRQRLTSLQDQLKAMRQDAKAGGDDGERRNRRRELQRQVQRGFQRDANQRLMQPVLSANGFYERLAAFWTNHFSTSANKSLPMRMIVPLYEAEAIRPNLGGSFRDLLRAATEHPAMLIYLDQAQSQGPDSPGGIRQRKGLNENLGRELLELHTLGAGSGYTQADVRGAAMVLTGLTVDRDDVDTVFRPRLSEPGQHSVLGIGYGGERRTRKDYLAMLDDLAAHPKTAEHVCRKLCIHFISDQPPSEMISAMADVWKRADGDLTAVYGAMLDHPAAWRDEGSKARQPFDFVVAGLRSLNAGSFMEANQDDDGDADTAMAAPPAEMAGGDAVKSVAPADPAGKEAVKRRKASQTARALGQGALRRMGQPVWLPPSPAGFEETFGAWITASQLAERLAWARRASAQLGKDEDPRDFLKATLGDAARDETTRVVSQAPSKISGLTLVLASPEFNRR